MCVCGVLSCVMMNNVVLCDNWIWWEGWFRSYAGKSFVSRVYMVMV